MNKVVADIKEAVADIRDGSVIMIGGFGGAGAPQTLIEALVQQGAKDLTLICNATASSAGFTDATQIKKIVMSWPYSVYSAWTRTALEGAARAGHIQEEIVPQGTLAERIRAGGAGIAGFYTAVGVGSILEQGKEKRVLEGQECVLELPLKADFALIGAYKGDRMGNLVYYKAGRNFNPLMAMAARVTIAEVQKIVPVGELDPEVIVTPGMFVHRIVQAEPRVVTWR